MFWISFCLPSVTATAPCISRAQTENHLINSIVIQREKHYVREQTGDIQKVDVGIALCHFVMGLEELGKAFEVLVEDPGIAVPDATEYIATVKAAD